MDYAPFSARKLYSIQAAEAHRVLLIAKRLFQKNFLVARPVDDINVASIYNKRQALPA